MVVTLNRQAGWHLLAGIALGCVAAGAGAEPLVEAKTLDGAALMREAETAVRLAGGLKLQVNKPTLREGESIQITLELPRAGYLNVVSINPAGEPTVLFPNQVQQGNQVEAGRFTLPTPQMNFDLQARAPFGTSLVVAFLTPQPLDLYANGDGERGGGALASQFARWSSIGRDLIGALGTKALVVEPRAAPMMAGMTTVQVCAAAGPCDAAAAATASAAAGSAAPHGSGFGARVAEILDAFTPGILLESVDKAYSTHRGPLRPVYDRGVTLTKVSEGFVPRVYNDAARYCSVAYGHLIKRSPCDGSEPAAYRNGLGEPAGARLLVGDMALAQRAVMSLVKVSLSDGQYAALCDFTYNVGAGNLQRSTLLKAVNAGQHERVPFQMQRWVNAGGKPQRGLKTRREREVALYFDGSTIPIPKSAPPGEDEAPIDIRSGEPGS